MQAVKNALRFIRWQWRRVDIILKLAFTAVLSLLISIVTMKFIIISNIFLAVCGISIAAMLITLASLILKEQYAEFKAERQELFNKMKNSDKQNYK